MGVCANAPMVQIDKDTYEDLTPAAFESMLDGFAAGRQPVPGSQIGRTASCPAGGPTTLTDTSLYDGSTIGAWRKRFEDTGGAGAPPAATPAASSPPPAAAGPVSAKPAMNTGAMAAIANAGLVKELNERGSGTPLSSDDLAKMKAGSVSRAPGGDSTKPKR